MENSPGTTTVTYLYNCTVTLHKVSVSTSALVKQLIRIHVYLYMLIIVMNF